jgi:choline monooxygenase
VPSDFVYEGNLARATTLPADWYLGEESLARDQRRIFGRTWQLVGHTAQVARPGDYFTCEVAGEPLVVARGGDGTLRALSNVCRHRAGPVAAGAGNRKTLQCGYHGWTYELDGHLRTTPEFEGVEDFERGSVCLPSVRADVFGPFVFATLDAQAPPLLDVLGPIAAETAQLGLERLRPYRRHDWEIACNWKVYVDNYLEGYHIPIVHPGLHKLLDYAAYRVEAGRWHSKQHAPLRRSVTHSLYQRHLPEGGEPEALYYWVFPNLMFNFYPDNLQVNVILPLAAERTLTRFEWFVAEPERPGLAEEFERSFSFSDEVQREDVAICEAVQRGLRSRFYERGRLSVARENGVHHFHGLVAEFVAQGTDWKG